MKASLLSTYILAITICIASAKEDTYLYAYGKCDDGSWVTIISQPMTPGATESNSITRDIFYSQFDKKRKGKTWVGAIFSATPKRKGPIYTTDCLALFRDVASREGAFHETHNSFSTSAPENIWAYHDLSKTGGAFSKIAVLVTKDPLTCKHALPKLK